jgi:hypothetical protein
VIFKVDNNNNESQDNFDTSDDKSEKFMKVLKCCAGEGWRRLGGPFMCKMKYHIDSKKTQIFHVQ